MENIDFQAAYSADYIPRYQCLIVLIFQAAYSADYREPDMLILLNHFQAAYSADYFCYLRLLVD